MNSLQNWTSSQVMSALISLLDAGILLPGLDNKPTLFDFAIFAKSQDYLSPAQLAIIRKELPAYKQYLDDLHKEAQKPVPIKENSAKAKAHFSIYNPKNIKLENCPIQLVQRIKNIPGFKQQDDFYLLPYSKRNAYVLKHSGFDMDARVQDFLDRADTIASYPDFSQIRKPLKNYQKQGISWLLSQERGGILADEQGLGKTAQAICWAELAGFDKICIVCPASLKLNWQREIEMWTGSRNSLLLSGKSQSKETLAELSDRKWIIINYDILSYWSKSLKNALFSAFIFDEAQALKNDKSKRTKAAKDIVVGANVLMLSGTPVENRPAEFYPMISMIDPLLFQSKTWFYRRYCDLKETPWGWDHRGATNTKELNRILTDTIMIRRKKADVLAELPEKQRATISLHLSDSALKEYRKAEKDFISWLMQNKPKKGAARTRQIQAAAMLKVGILKQLAAKAKLPLVYDWINAYLENEDKLVVFAEHKEIISALKKEFEKISVIVDGSVAAEKRQAACDSFQNDKKVKLFIGNIKAAGTGLTLTAAKDTLTVEFAWTSTAHDQCEDRVHRIGQKNSVMAYYLLAENTIEKRIVKMLDKKRNVVSQILDGQEPVDIDFFDALLDELEQGK